MNSTKTQVFSKLEKKLFVKNQIFMKRNSKIPKFSPEKKLISGVRTNLFRYFCEHVKYLLGCLFLPYEIEDSINERLIELSGYEKAMNDINVDNPKSQEILAKWDAILDRITTGSEFTRERAQSFIAGVSKKIYSKLEEIHSYAPNTPSILSNWRKQYESITTIVKKLNDLPDGDLDMYKFSLIHTIKHFFADNSPFIKFLIIPPEKSSNFLKDVNCSLKKIYECLCDLTHDFSFTSSILQHFEMMTEDLRRILLNSYDEPENHSTIIVEYENSILNQKSVILSAYEALYDMEIQSMNKVQQLSQVSDDDIDNKKALLEEENENLRRQIALIKKERAKKKEISLNKQVLVGHIRGVNDINTILQSTIEELNNLIGEMKSSDNNSSESRTAVFSTQQLVESISVDTKLLSKQREDLNFLIKQRKDMENEAQNEAEFYNIQLLNDKIIQELKAIRECIETQCQENNEQKVKLEIERIRNEEVRSIISTLINKWSNQTKEVFEILKIESPNSPIPNLDIMPRSAFDPADELFKAKKSLQLEYHESRKNGISIKQLEEIKQEFASYDMMLEKIEGSSVYQKLYQCQAELNSLRDSHLKAVDTATEKKEDYIRTRSQILDIDTVIALSQIEMKKNDIDGNVDESLLKQITALFQEKLALAQEIRQIYDWLDEEFGDEVRNEEILINKFEKAKQICQSFDEA